MSADVLLIAMPNLLASMPSLALSLLKAGLARIGVPCSIAYWNLPFAERIGTERYTKLENVVFGSLGDWVFSHSLFGHSLGVSDEYPRLLDTLPITLPEGHVEAFRYARDRADEFLEDRLRQVDWSRYRVVGLTTCFDQNTATLALAWRIKERNPQVKIVLGGANCQGEMGRQLLNLFPFVDFVCLGEGDVAFPALVQALNDGGVGETLPPGMIGRVNGKVIEADCRAPLADLDELPYPDYDDYFEALEASSLRDQIEPKLPLETSRGCWWGEKQHCTFCGLNALDMASRSKTPERAIEEIRTVAARYGPRMGERPLMMFTDNILNLGYFKTVLPELKEVPFRFFYETKSNLKKGQVEALADSGVTNLQPGIESLSSSVLKLMRKGCNRLQNIQILKWCSEVGIDVSWNMLTGFPGEDPEEYRSQYEVMKNLLHLPPPEGVGRFVLERFSPYFTDPGKYGIGNVRPLSVYRHIYPFSEGELARLVHRFAFDFSDGRNPDAYTGEMLQLIERWKSDECDEYLFGTDVDGTLLIWYGREVRTQEVHRLEGVHRLVCLYCDEIRGLRGIERYVREAGRSPDGCGAILDDLVGRKLMVREGDRYLSLPVLLLQVERSGELRPAAEVSEVPAGGVSIDSTLRPAPLIATVELNDCTVLFDPRKRRLHLLNETAGAIWELCTEGMCAADVGQTIADSLDVDPGVVRADTVGVIRELADRQLLIVNEPPA